MGKKLAFMTYGHLIEAFGHPSVQTFGEAAMGVFSAADGNDGMVDRHRRLEDRPDLAWGAVVSPKCWGGEVLPCTVATLSIWNDIESVTAFAYHGAHGEAMRRRHEWFVHPGLPEHVAWWTEMDKLTWQEAADRMDDLFENGSNPGAFSLRKPYDAEGNPYKIDAVAVRSKAFSIP